MTLGRVVAKLAGCISPVSSCEHALYCVAAFWHEEWGEPAYKVNAGLLFGPRFAVTLFRQRSRFAEAS